MQTIFESCPTHPHLDRMRMALLQSYSAEMCLADSWPDSATQPAVASTATSSSVRPSRRRW